ARRGGVLGRGNRRCACWPGCSRLRNVQARRAGAQPALRVDGPPADRSAAADRLLLCLRRGLRPTSRPGPGQAAQPAQGYGDQMMRQFAIAAPRIFDGAGWHTDAALLVEDGSVLDIVPRGSVPAGAPLIETDGILAPGFVDLQVNGGGGVMLNDRQDVEAIRTICTAHARFGTTALLPTLITDTPEITASAVAGGTAAAQAGVPGFAGLHLEGPHLSLARKGAHDPK